MPYGVSYGLTYKDVQALTHAAYVAAMAGRPLNAFVTFAPPKMTPDAARQRMFATYRGHLSQALERKGYPLIAAFVRERKAVDPHGAGEHLHALVHAPDAAAFAIIKAVRSDMTVVEPNDGTPEGDTSRLFYVTKARTPQCEGLMAKNSKPRHPWERPAPINGRRWSLSKALAAMARAYAPSFAIPKNPRPKRKPKLASPKPTPAPVPRPMFGVIEGGQIELFATRPVSRLRDYGHGVMPPAVAIEVRHHQRRLGLTQQQLADACKISRPTLANALQGRFALSEWAAAQLRHVLLRPHGPPLPMAA